MEISKRIQKELSDLKAVKETFFKVVKKIEDDKKAMHDQEEHDHFKKFQNAKELLEEEHRRETIRLEAERTMKVEE